ncbi:MAG TPA: hypothetical protein VIX63_13060 [Vicinamibacterales bacterium]
MSRSRVVAVAAACLVAAGVVLHSNYTWAVQEQANVVPQANEQLEIAIGFKIAPVPLKFAPSNRALVGLGSYIVNGQGGCNDCHTNPPFAPGGDPFLGEPTQINAEHYLAGGMQFGPVTSRNLTPRSNGRPAGLTFAQFRSVIRTGFDLKYVHPEISPLLQVMPWPVYRYMHDSDLVAVYTYLSAIPPATPGP